MRRILPYPMLSTALAVAWLLLTGNLEPVTLLGAVLLGVAIPWPMARVFPAAQGMHRPLTAVRLGLVVMRDIVVSNIVVARLVLGRSDRLRPTFIEVPLATTHPYVVNLLASIITMTPGTVSAIVDPGRRRLTVHALDCADPAALITDIKQRYERPLLEIFGCSPPP